MKFSTSNQPLTVFSYSSLTDIVLLLVIFFLLTSQFVIQTGVKVKLPGSKTNEQSEPTKMIVTITSAGVIYAGPDQTTIDMLSGKLTEMRGVSDEANLVIRADKTVQIDIVIKVIDAAKSVGIGKFTIETEKENP
ncbi:MAG: biopolymer transporter ExbD [Ignavibacteriaceae bacterium]|jgi:biopolymer transport protein ExbD|nr:biopolymer transporter ExbD [Ignavibacteriaceae bacterium]MCU0364912.1 biopolymer transporter ExbD [Ignavibacteriaceae bacterium]MCU0406546.1 biopolymer transporter ExbD [Ignavibacteriaceae bacterium]